MTPEQFDRLWQDPAHWNAWGYNCAKDPRIIVPKPNPSFGWTVNFAHAKARWLVVFTVICLFGPAGAILLAEGASLTPWHVAATLLVSVNLMVAVWFYFLRNPVN